MKSKPLKIVIALAVLAAGFTAYTYAPIWFNIDLGSSDRGCTTVIVSAKNIITQEVRTFSDPCSVPFGWTQLPLGSTQ